MKGAESQHEREHAPRVGSDSSYHELLDGVIENGEFSLLEHVPHGSSAMDPVVRSLMAVLAQWDAQVVQALLDVVSI